MAFGYKTINVRKDGNVIVLTLSRPEKLNALDSEMIADLGDAVKTISADADCRCVVFEGAGEKAFSTGVDISYLRTLSTNGNISRFVDGIHDLFESIEDLDKPTIAVINGFCLGGGLELALSCDIRISTPTSKFGLPEVGLGLIPGAGGTFRLPRLVGISKAKEIIFTAGIVGAEEAHKINLVNFVVEKWELLETAMSLAKSISNNSGNAVSMAKKSIDSNFRADSSIEKGAFISCFKHPDSAEGIDAFLKHRKPKFI